MANDRVSLVVIGVGELRELIREEVRAVLEVEHRRKMTLLDRQELASELNVSASTIDRWRKQRKLRPTLILGESPRWRLDDALSQLSGSGLTAVEDDDG